MILNLLNNKFGSYVIDSLLRQQFNKTKEVKIKNEAKIILSVPNRLSKYRADTFLTKEPETIEWLDSLSKNSVLWDIV